MNNFFELNNKLAIVTGSGRGIGKSLAFALANAGCDIILTSRSKNELKEVNISYSITVPSHFKMLHFDNKFRCVKQS